MDFKDRNTDYDWLKNREPNSQSPPPQKSDQENQSQNQEPINWSDNQPPIQNNPPQTNYPPPPYNNPPLPGNYNQYAYQNQSPGNSLAISGFVIALVSIFLVWIPVLNIILCILGLSLSIVGIKKSKKLNNNGKGLAIAGLVISAVFTVISIIWIVVFIIASNELFDDYNDFKVVYVGMEVDRVEEALDNWIVENKRLPTTIKEVSEIVKNVEPAGLNEHGIGFPVKSIQKAKTSGQGIYFTPNDSAGPKLPTSDEMAPFMGQMHIITGVKCKTENAITQLKSNSSKRVAYNDKAETVVEKTNQLTFAIIYASDYETSRFFNSDSNSKRAKYVRCNDNAKTNDKNSEKTNNDTPTELEPNSDIKE